MASIKCDIINPNYESLLKVIKEWSSKEQTKKNLRNPFDAAFRLAERDFLVETDYLKYDLNQEILTKGRLNAFKKTLDNLNNKVANGSLDNDFAQFFWQTSRYGRQDPVIGSYFRSVQNASFMFRKNELGAQNSLKNVMIPLRELGKKRELSSRYNGRNAERYLKRLDNDLAKAINNKDDAKINEIYKVREQLVSNTHLQVFDEFIDIVEKSLPKATQKVYEKRKAEALNGNQKSAKLIENVDANKRVIRLTNSEMAKYVLDSNGKKLDDNMYRALVEYNDMMGNLYLTLRNGVDQRIKSIIAKLKFNGDEKSAEKIKEIGKKLEDKLMPKYEGDGYFPHYIKDLSAPFMDKLMPHLDNMQNAVNPYIKDKNKSIRDVINDVNEYIIGHAKGRIETEKTKDEQVYDYNRNFLNVISSYITDVNRFNFASFTDGYFIDAMTSVENIYRTTGSAKGYGQNLVDYISDLHMASNGDTNISPKTRAVMRSLLGFEFISKIGFNPRSAARNFTQRLLDYVEWGPLMVKRMNEELKNITFKDRRNNEIGVEFFVESELKKAGLLFEESSPQLVESGLTAPASMFNLRQWNESKNRFEIIEKSKTEGVADLISAGAAKSSWLHRKAENSNRKHTFKIAFAQLHHWLDGNRLFNERMGDQGLSELEIANRVRKVASNYAKNMVILNHFDYADYAKSKAFRSGIGRFMFQFQHYSMEFFERNLRIMREAKGDILSGELLPTGDARGLAKAYRLAMAYFIAPAVASALTGVNFENLVEHDSAQRINQLATLLTGDDDEIKEAFYGKGPIISTFGGPLASDILDIGVMLDLINIEEDSLLTLITGLEKYDTNNQSTDLTKKLRLLNTFLGRFVERHIPQLAEGRIGWAVQQELGLYPTAEARKKKDLAKAVVPKEIEQALQQLMV